MPAAVRLENFCYAWPGASAWTLRELSFDLPQGECHWLSGVSGSGKTTLALALKDLLPPGRQQGHFNLPSPPEEKSSAVGLVLQNPETQLLTETIGSEVAFGLENLCVPTTEMPARVRAALDAVGLDLPFGHLTSRLSMGQKYRLLIACQLVLRPSLLILDEPAGQLDEPGLESLARIIASLKSQGLSVLLCEHRPGPLKKVIDRCWQLAAAGHLLPGENDPALPADSTDSKTPELNAAPLVEVRGLQVSEDDATPAWRELDLQLAAGQRALLCAPNGAGKTTLLRCLAGLLRPSHGRIRIGGKPPHQDRCGRIGYLFQNPRRQLFETTVFNEVAFGLCRQGIKGVLLTERVHLALQRCGIGQLAERSPHQLSYGQQHLVALASVLAREPELLLLDDPLAGLDPKAAAQVLETIRDFNEERGATVLWTSHHQPERGNWNHVRFGIEGGRLVQH